MDKIWEIEESFWLKGRSHYERHLHAHCQFAFPEPTGLLKGNSSIANLDEGSPWTSVKLHERTESQPAQNVFVLSYRGVGTKTDGSPYSAYCTTTYVIESGVPMLVQHQQTPTGD
ncbi:MAG: hypothetical protein AAFU56_01610 [Pseudomonadota bacterium]